MNRHSPIKENMLRAVIEEGSCSKTRFQVLVNVREDGEIADEVEEAASQTVEDLVINGIENRVKKLVLNVTERLLIKLSQQRSILLILEI